MCGVSQIRAAELGSKVPSGRLMGGGGVKAGWMPKDSLGRCFDPLRSLNSQYYCLPPCEAWAWQLLQLPEAPHGLHIPLLRINWGHMANS